MILNTPSIRYFLIVDNVYYMLWFVGVLFSLELSSGSAKLKNIQQLTYANIYKTHANKEKSGSFDIVVATTNNGFASVPKFDISRTISNGILPV